jgi:hypothetical protein
VRPTEPGAEAKVGQLDMAVPVDEDVVRLDVSVDEPHLVHALDGADKFSNVEPTTPENKQKDNFTRLQFITLIKGT